MVIRPSFYIGLNNFLVSLYKPVNGFEFKMTDVQLYGVSKSSGVQFLNISLDFFKISIIISSKLVKLLKNKIS